MSVNFKIKKFKIKIKCR